LTWGLGQYVNLRRREKVLEKMQQYLEDRHEELREQRDRGSVDIGAILMMGIGMVFLAVGFIMFPIVTTATDTLLAWNCTANVSFTDLNFTGFTPIIGITPLLVLIGYLSAAVFSMFLGVKMIKGGAGSTKLDLGSILMLGISMIFIAIGLIILPVVLDAICPLVTGANMLNAVNYAGLIPILLVTPLLVLISFVTAAVVTGYFGIKRLGG